MKTHTFIRLTAAALIGAATVFSSCKKVIDETTVKEIIITDPASKSLTLEQGDDYRIYYDVLPASALNTAVIDWSSSDERIAGVSGFDRIYAYAPGNATITGKCGDAEVEIEVTVTKVQVTSFTVPEKLTIYVGLENEIEMTIEPAKANASSLDWEYDKEMVELNFKEGKAIVKGLKSGSCAMTVKSESTAKTINLTIKELTERIQVSYSHNSNSVVVQNGDKVSWNDIFLSSLLVKVGDGITLPEDVTISSSDPSVCKDFIFHKLFSSASIYVLGLGEEFGSTEITVSTNDKLLNRVHKLSFTLTSEPKGIPGDIAVKVSGGPILKNGDSYRMDKNSQQEFNIEPYGNFANWTVEGGNMDIEYLLGNDVWSVGAKITCGEQTGTTTVTVKDQTGKSMSFNINVTEQIFSEGIYIIDDETGKKAEGAVYIPCGGSKIFRLSNENYKGKWSVGRPEYYTVEPISPDENGYCTKVKITTTKDAWQKGTYIQVVDKANLNSISVEGLWAGIDFSKITGPTLRSSIGNTQISSGKFVYFTWDGQKTDYYDTFYLRDADATRYEKLPGVTFSVEKSDEDSGFTIGTDQTMMQRTGEIPVTWKEKYGREAILTLTDHWGHQMSFSFKPRIDFFNGKWRIHQKYNGKSSITTWHDLPKDPPSRKITISSAQKYYIIDNEKDWDKYEIFFINTDDNQGFAWDYKCYYIDCEVSEKNNNGWNYKPAVLNKFELRPGKNIAPAPQKPFKLLFRDSQGKSCFIEIHFNYEY